MRNPTQCFEIAAEEAIAQESLLHFNNAHRPAMESLVTPPTILIVDDDPMVLATLKVSLATEPYEVVVASSPIDALKLLPGTEFSVIISDQKMPRMTGLDFLVECRRLRPQASRILLTAVLNLATAVEAINRGEICRFIAKPWLRVELIAAVRDAMQRHDLATHNQALQAQALRLNEQLTLANRELKARIDELERRTATPAPADGPPAWRS
jgi:DNA-binding NtrC family response regulator